MHAVKRLLVFFTYAYMDLVPTAFQFSADRFSVPISIISSVCRIHQDLFKIVLESKDFKKQ